jgi:hypothetical protein
MTLSTSLELAGMAAIAVAAWLLNPIFGLALTGLGLIIAGLGIDRSSK